MKHAAVPDDVIHPMRRLELAREGLAERQAIHVRQRAAHASLEQAKTERQAIRDRLTQKQLDVDRLQGRSTTRFWSRLRGDHAGDLERKRAEAAKVADALEQAKNQQESRRDEVEQLAQRAVQLEGADLTYELALEGVAGSTSSPQADSAGSAREAARELVRIRETRAVELALSAARSALQGLSAAKDVLHRADALSTYDTLGGGGRFVSRDKHRHLNETRQRLQAAGDSVKRLSSLLDGQAIRAVVLPEFSDTTRTLDIWLDNGLSDLMVAAEIRRCRTGIETTIREVREVLASLEARRAELSPDAPFG